MKKKIIFGITLIVAMVILLSGCGNAPKPIGIVASAPENAIVEQDIFPRGEITVYRIYDTGNVEKVENWVASDRAEVGSIGNAGFSKYTIIDRDNPDLSTELTIITNAANSEPLKAEDTFYVYRFHVETNEKGAITKSIFTHNLGYSVISNLANKETGEVKLEDYLQVYRIGPSEDGTKTIQEDVTGLINIEDGEFPISYKSDSYNATFVVKEASGNKNVSFPVVVAGGERPLHAKSANWFDYILVIPVGWLMQLFSFGGNFAIGILFATLIIRTLAWPIYAKSNAMSANMNEAQPELQRIQAKYRGRSDKASQQQMQMETMAIYKKYKIGMSSLFMPFLQMPIFIAMFRTLSRILIPGGYWADKINVRTFLGFNLEVGASGGPWYYYILAVIVGATMFLLQYISMKKPGDQKKTAQQSSSAVTAQQGPNTAKTMKIFSFVMIIMMVIFSLQNNAMAIYWIIGNLFSLGQTLIHRRLNKAKAEKKQEDTLGGIL